MSSQIEAPAAVPASDVVDLTAGLSDLDMDHESGHEDKNLDEESKSVCLPAKKKKTRKGRRGGKDKKKKALEKTNKLNKMQEDVFDDASDDDADSVIPSEEGTVPVMPLSAPHHARQKAPEYVNAPKDYVPVVPHYQIRALPGTSEADVGKPTEKHGVFATKDIDAGARIICEHPLITLPAPGDQILQLMHAFCVLPEDQQDKIWSLNPADSSSSPLLTYMGEQIASKIVALQHILAKSIDEYTEEDCDFLRHDVLKLEEATKMSRLAARWHAGRHSLINLPENERSNLPPGTPITGLFVETARLRHSCIPNCYAHYDPTTNRMTVHATSPIPIGDELTLSHIASVYYLSAAERANELKTKFNITCTCAACSPRDPNFSTHEQARLLAHTRALNAAHFLTLLILVDSSSDVTTDLMIRDSERPDAPPDIDDLLDAQSTCLALINDLKSTGCEGPEVVRWFNALIDRILPSLADLLADNERMKLWTGMRQYALECEKVVKRSFGADSVEVAQAVLRKDRIGSLLAGAVERLSMVEEGRRKVGRAGKKGWVERGAKKEKEKPAEARRKQEWEIVGAMAPEGVARVVESQKGQVVGMMGKHPVVR